LFLIYKKNTEQKKGLKTFCPFLYHIFTYYFLYK